MLFFCISIKPVAQSIYISLDVNHSLLLNAILTKLVNSESDRTLFTLPRNNVSAVAISFKNVKRNIHNVYRARQFLSYSVDNLAFIVNIILSVVRIARIFQYSYSYHTWTRYLHNL